MAAITAALAIGLRIGIASRLPLKRERRCKAPIPEICHRLAHPFEIGDRDDEKVPGLAAGGGADSTTGPMPRRNCPLRAIG
jgi:hypothetical protein